MTITPPLIATICTIVAAAALIGWPREDDPRAEPGLSDADWSHYFIRLYQATFEGFDRGTFRAARRYNTPTKERVEREARAAAYTAVIRAWQDASARYDGEWQRINRGYFTMIARLRDEGMMA